MLVFTIYIMSRNDHDQPGLPTKRLTLATVGQTQPCLYYLGEKPTGLYAPTPHVTSHRRLIVTPHTCIKYRSHTIQPGHPAILKHTKRFPLSPIIGQISLTMVYAWTRSI